LLFDDTGARSLLGTAALAAMLHAGVPAIAAEMPSRASAGALAAARLFLCPHGGRPIPGRRGRCSGGTASGSGGNTAIGWMAGLPPATNRQATCPPGTVPAAALARAESTRCLPE